MKVMLTGATGFLGRHVLSLLCQRSGIETIYVVTRQDSSHPHPRVSMVKCDLSNPIQAAKLPHDMDHVIHLAGQYNFSMSRELDYLNNVLVAQNLLKFLESLDTKNKPRIHYASTYAVGFGQNDQNHSERALPHSIKAEQAYTNSKRLVERMFLESNFFVRLFRLGILTGNSLTGDVEKIDGPYYFIKLLARLHSIGMLGHLPVLPIPARGECVLPLVPVDYAAETFALSLTTAFVEKHEIFGVYNKESVSVENFVKEALSFFGSEATTVFVPGLKGLPLRLQTELTGIPAEIFEFGISGPLLDNRKYIQTFSDNLIPHFSVYRTAFFHGVKEWIRGVNDAA